MTRTEAIERINARQNAANLFTNIGEEEIKKEIACATIGAALENLEGRKDRSAWDKAVTEDAIDLLNDLLNGISDGWIDATVIGNRTRTEAAMLNGANDWKHYSWSGCALCYNGQIAKHYCTPSEYKRTHAGAYKPNASEEWLDVQARALWQAARRVHEAIEKGAM